MEYQFKPTHEYYDCEGEPTGEYLMLRHGYFYSQEAWEEGGRVVSKDDPWAKENYRPINPPSN